MWNNSQSAPAQHNQQIDRSSFFNKVVGFFTLALVMSLIGGYVTSKFFIGYLFASQGLLWLIWGAEMALILTARKWSKIAPINYWLFIALTFLTGVSAAPLVVFAIGTIGPMIVFKALAITILTFAATALYGWTTHRNLSGLGGFLQISLIGLIITAIIGAFIPFNTTTELIVSGFAVIVFSGYTMYDMQMLKHYPEDRYIEAAMNLYLDIFNLFIAILRILIAMNRD